MSLLSGAELKKLEKKHPEGIGSADVVQIFRQKGERFSEATLRKYVQLGLLPKSRRVGTRGRHRGSSGRYPVAVIRIINDIKQALDQGATLEEIRVTRVGLTGEVESLQRLAEQVIERFDEAVRQRGRVVGGVAPGAPAPAKAGSDAATMKRALEQHKKSLLGEVQKLGRFAQKLVRQETIGRGRAASAR
jgi:DNA-binding transcriptional MerR regulator